jgi:hypothetical protein
MTSPRSGHTATTLSNGNILFTGGGSDSAEIFDGTSFSVAGSLTVSRANHSAALMADDIVLLSLELLATSTTVAADCAGGGACVGVCAEA